MPSGDGQFMPGRRSFFYRSKCLEVSFQQKLPALTHMLTFVYPFNNTVQPMKLRSLQILEARSASEYDGWVSGSLTAVVACKCGYYVGGRP